MTDTNPIMDNEDLSEHSEDSKTLQCGKKRTITQHMYPETKSDTVDLVGNELGLFLLIYMCTLTTLFWVLCRSRLGK